MNLRNIRNDSFVAVYEQGDVKIQGIRSSTNIFIKKVSCYFARSFDWGIWVVEPQNHITKNAIPTLFSGLQGSLNATISRINHESRIHVEDGDIHLKLSDTNPLKLSISANKVLPNTTFSAHGKVCIHLSKAFSFFKK